MLLCFAVYLLLVLLLLPLLLLPVLPVWLQLELHHLQ
jgi:hypothetical protein